MRAHLAILIGLTLLAACAGDGGNEAAGSDAEHADPAADPAAVDTAAADTAAAPTLETEGYLNEFGEAGFRIYLPSGCGGLSEQVSSGPTPRAEREFIYNCNRDGSMGSGVRIRVYQGAHDDDGSPPHPRLVTELVENHLRNSGTRILRQRPLSAAGVQGVDVHAGEDGGPGETWIRGLLSGGDVFILLAWEEKGGLFEDPEVVDFFASFRVGTD